MSHSVRPRISVMLPVYEPDRRLAEALASVLRQDPGPDKMQIAVVDDGSSDADVAKFIAESGSGDRIELHRSSCNRGLAANWNECIRLARGGVVHLLHQDDRVDDGFYRRLLPAFAQDDVGMAFCRHAFIDATGRVTGRSHRERWTAGRLRGWLARIAESQRIQCASALVRRSVYERLGGYRADLRYALDWEMWVRIAAQYAVWYEPQVLAYYRRHEGAETARLRRESAIHRDVFQAIQVFGAHLPSSRRARMLSAAYARFARRMLRLMESGRIEEGGATTEIELVREALGRMTHAPLSALRYRRRLRRLVR